jgi:hypothetical protein
MELYVCRSIDPIPSFKKKKKTPNDGIRSIRQYTNNANPMDGRTPCKGLFG